MIYEKVVRKCARMDGLHSQHINPRSCAALDPVALPLIELELRGKSKRGT